MTPRLSPTGSSLPFQPESVCDRRAVRSLGWVAGLCAACLGAILIAGHSPVFGQNGKRAARKSEPSANAPASRPAATVPASVVPDSSSGTEADQHPLHGALELANRSREAMAQVTDYTATFSKRELIGNRMTTQSMDMKFRSEPFSVYFHFRGPEAGREVIYVHGRNRGNLLVHETGVASIAGTLQFAPTAPEVMRNTRYPITKAGVLNMLETIIGQWEGEMKYGEVDVKFFPNAKLGEIPCIAVQATHPTPRREFKFHQTRLYVDKSTLYPVRVEQFAWPKTNRDKAPLVEEYTYTNLQPNVGLTDRDFDPKNPNYDF